MKKILTEAADVGAATARTLAARPRDDMFYFYPGEGVWSTPFPGGSHEFLDDGVRVLDARSYFHFYATGITPAMTMKMVGKGSQYAVAYLDAEGNAFAVPVIARPLTAVCLALQPPATVSASPLSLWEDQRLPTPCHADVLDDHMEEIKCIADAVGDLVAEFHTYIPEVWDGALIGPDPGARSKTNRAQLAASSGTQLAPHLSNKG